MGVQKQHLRQRIKDTLKNFDSDSLRAKSLSVSHNLQRLFESDLSHLLNPKNDLVIGGFSCLPDEVQWHLGWERRPENFLFSVPHLIDEGTMEYYRVSLDAIASREIGLELSAEMRQQKVIPQAILVPGMAFTKNGHRLGRGKGYFDRYLENYRGPKIGLCFEEQLLDELPCEEHDQRMDYVVSEWDYTEVNK